MVLGVRCSACTDVAEGDEAEAAVQVGRERIRRHLEVHEALHLVLQMLQDLGLKGLKDGLRGGMGRGGGGGGLGDTKEKKKSSRGENTDREGKTSPMMKQEISKDL